MITKYLIHRRPFNPKPSQKDIKVLVASFGRTAKEEAEFCLAALQKCATDLKNDNVFSNYRYTLYTIPGRVDTSKSKVLQLDTSKARPTGRAITYDLTWESKHGRCRMLAYSKLYGAIRAEVEDSVEGRQFFIRAISRVWRNATLTTK